jgi:D-alanyl-D-alanine carboxypeptidase/D-alanyl-D-alanine-endopeptidase (penicillin-binding protein 4)
MKSSLLVMTLAVLGLAAGASAIPIQKELHPALPSPFTLRLKKAVENVLPPGKKDLDVGIMAVSLDTKEILYERSGDLLLIPASVNKVFTAYAALKKLKPTATFKTTVYTVGTVKEGKLTGDLYVKGGGDPSLVSERLWMLVNELYRSGIRTISGNLIGDSSYFDLEKTPETRPKYLKDQAYNAPVGALSFNFNTTTIYVKPGESLGLPPVVYTDPENSYIDVVNQATTGKPGSKNTVVVSRTDFVKGDIGDTVLIRGTLPLDHHEMRFYRNIVNPALYTVHIFKMFMEQRGIRFMGNVLEGTVPERAKQILEFESLPLWQVIWGMNKFSNNFVADEILKKLGAEAHGEPGTLQKGVAAIEEALEDLGISRRNYQIVDGSGLTRNTHVTARQIVTVLAATYKDFGMAPEFISSLGIAGEDGTVRHRFSNAPVEGQLRAKTGTLDGASALAGYVPSADGELIAFAILLNDPKFKYGRMTSWIDQIALAISKFSRK